MTQTLSRSGARKRVILHIGHGKTGSSAIQSFLAINADALARAGITYPAHPSFETARRGAVTSGNVDLNPGWFETRVLAEADNAPAGATLLFSNESMFWYVPGLLDRMAALHSEIEFRIILFVRDPLDIMTSAYLQGIKFDGLAEDIATYADREKHTTHAATVIRGCRDRGVDIAVLNYSHCRDTLIPAFLAQLLPAGADTGGFTFDTAQAVVNRSLTDAEARLMRRINAASRGKSWRALAEKLINRCRRPPGPAFVVPRAVATRYLERIAPAVDYINTVLPSGAALRLTPPPAESAADPGSYVFVQQQIDAIADHLAGVQGAVLVDADADLLRTVALKYESGAVLTRAEGIGLMELALRARPNGPMISRTLDRWKKKKPKG